MNVKCLVSSTILFLTMSNLSNAGVINFETLPNGATPTDNQELTTAYTVGGVTVRFGFDSNGDGQIDVNPYFEKSGGSDSAPHGFINNQLVTWDEPLSGNLGDFFLRGGGFGRPDAIPGVFVIAYQTPGVTALSGEVWDVDGGGAGGIFERWDFRVYDVDGDLAATDTTGFGTQAGDARPFVFSFSGITAGVQRVELEYTGTRPPQSVGLAFDNFNATQAATVPEPSGLMTWSGFLLFVGICRRRSRKARVGMRRP